MRKGMELHCEKKGKILRKCLRKPDAFSLLLLVCSLTTASCKY